MTSNDSVDEIECCQVNDVQPIPTMNDPDSDAGEDNGAWSFESDHAALKNNSDYMNLLRTLTFLQAQRIQTIKDLEKLHEIKEKANDDPVAFIERMQNGEDMGFPAPMKVAEVPHIDWSNYKAGPRGHTRLHTRSGLNNPAAAVPPPEAKEDQEAGGVQLVRGRPFDDSKPVTFNQLWTAEEQGRLEELLAEFPPEQVEQNRYRKIAAALGNRTAQQVSSRIQKYFVKLHRAGLPVPGRSPRCHQDSRSCARRHRHQRNNHLLLGRPSTFFPSLPPSMDHNREGGATYLGADGRPRVHTRESVAGGSGGGEDEGEGEGGDGGEEDSDDSDRDTMNIAGKVERARATRLVALLQRVVQSRKGEKSTATHHGFKCDLCEEEPIVGTRWHCNTCAAVTSFDFCDECVVTQAESSSPHPLAHHLEATSSVATSDSIHDEDYGPQAFARRPGDYNYLDPNFMPL